MIYVSRIESDVKGGVNVELGPRTLVVGPNASRKTAIVQSMELALRGRVTDLVGRTEVAREADLMSLAPGREGTLWARAHLSDGSVSSYSTVGSSAKAKKGTLASPALVDPARCFPLHLVREAVLGAPETTRRFFLESACKQVTAEEVLACLPAAMHERYLGLASGASDPLEGLLRAMDQAKKMARESVSKGKNAAEVIVLQTAGLARPPSDEELAQTREKLSVLEAALEATLRAEGLATIRKEAETNLPGLKRELESAQSTFSQLEKALVVDPAGNTRLVRSVSDLLVFLSSCDAKDCPVCGGSIDQGRLAANVGFVRSQLNRAELDDRRRVEQRSVLERERSRVQALRSRIVHFEDVLARPATSDLADVEKLRTEIQSVRAQQEEMQLATRAWRTVQASKDSAAYAEEEADELKRLADRCQEVVGELLDQGVDQFSERVQAFLPPSDKFCLRLRDGSREVCQFGLLRDGVLHTALSGAEWSRVVAAVSAAVIPDGDGKLYVVCPEERALDPDTLSEVLVSFSSLPCQVVITTPILPSPVPSAWTIVRTGSFAVAASERASLGAA